MYGTEDIVAAVTVTFVLTIVAGLIIWLVVVSAKERRKRFREAVIKQAAQRVFNDWSFQTLTKDVQDLRVAVQEMKRED